MTSIPENWETSWLKWSVELSTTRPDKEEQNKLPYISNEDISSWTGELLVEDPQPTTADSRKFQKDDILFNKFRPYLAKVFHADFDGVSSSELLCLRPSKTVYPRFLFYFLVSKGFIDTINAETFGAKMPRADWETIRHQPFPHPPIHTQRSIAQFLDDKTEWLDTLVEKKRVLLERLAEKRQALITSVVTGNLNTTEPAKIDKGRQHRTLKEDRYIAEMTHDMGHYFISDDVPDRGSYTTENWETSWLKWSVELSTTRPAKEEQNRLPYISNEDISSWTGELLVEDPQPTTADSRKFQKDDILFNKFRPYLAKVFHADFDGVSSSELLCLRPSRTICPRFLFYFLVSKGFIDTINAETFVAKMPRADWETIRHQPFPHPPIHTQRSIALFLDSETAQIDKQSRLIEHSIDLLFEYRAALITAATTGQISGLQ